MKYSEAIEQKFAYISFLERERSLPPRPTDTPESLQIRRGLRLLLPLTETYFWSHQIANAVLQSAMTLPGNTTVLLEGVPRAGWMWFERPFRAGVMAKWSEVRALSWTHDNGTIVITSYGGPPGAPLTLDMGYCALIQGTSLFEITDSQDWQSHLTTLGAFWIAAMLWIQQMVIVTERREPDRHTRRRLERSGITPSPIHVVRLRRAVVSGHPNTSNEHKEWTCQWIVRGHWRQQFYPSTNAHRPKWILPYVKGPEDAPLKPPAPTVFAVTR
jgi:hypothetical protein